MKIKINKIIKVLIYIWIVMWSVNLMNKGTRIALVGGLLITVVLLINKKKISPSFMFVAFQIIAFGIVYTLLINYYEQYSFLRGNRDMFIPVILYTVGYFSISINNKDEDDEKTAFIQKLFILIAISLFLYASANLFIHLFTYGQFSFYNRRMYDIWTGSLTAATTQGSRYILMSAMLPPIILARWKKNSITKVSLLVCILITIVSTLIMANRTLLGILFINFLVCLIMFVKLEKFKITKIIRALGTIGCISLLFFSIYSNDVFGVRTFYKDSNFYIRMQVIEGNHITENSRIDAWKTTVKGIYYFPMGGSRAPIVLSAPHNLWLDVAYTTGVIPFFLLIILTIYYIYFYMVLLKSEQINNDFKIFLTSIMISLLLNSTVEPIMGGHYILFMVFMLQLGLMHGIINNLKIDKYRG